MLRNRLANVIALAIAKAMANRVANGSQTYRTSTGTSTGTVLLPQLFLLKRCRLRRFAPQLPTKPLPNKRSGQELTQACFPTTDRARTR